MAKLRMDAASVQSLSRNVLETADRLDEIDWPTMNPDAMTGSAAVGAARMPELEERLADVVAHLRTWAAAVQASTTAIDTAQLRHARSLGEPR